MKNQLIIKNSSIIHQNSKERGVFLLIGVLMTLTLVSLVIAFAYEVPFVKRHKAQEIEDLESVCSTAADDLPILRRVVLDLRTAFQNDITNLPNRLSFNQLTVISPANPPTGQLGGLTGAFINGNIPNYTSLGVTGCSNSSCRFSTNVANAATSFPDFTRLFPPYAGGAAQTAFWSASGQKAWRMIFGTQDYGGLLVCARRKRIDTFISGDKGIQVKAAFERRQWRSDSNAPVRGFILGIDTHLETGSNLTRFSISNPGGNNLALPPPVGEQDLTSYDILENFGAINGNLGFSVNYGVIGGTPVDLIGVPPPAIGGIIVNQAQQREALNSSMNLHLLVRNTFIQGIVARLMRMSAGRRMTTVTLLGSLVPEAIGTAVVQPGRARPLPLVYQPAGNQNPVSYNNNARDLAGRLFESAGDTTWTTLVNATPGEIPGAPLTPGPGLAYAAPVAPSITYPGGGGIPDAFYRSFFRYAYHTYYDDTRHIFPVSGVPAGGILNGNIDALVDNTGFEDVSLTPWNLINRRPNSTLDNTWAQPQTAPLNFNGPNDRRLNIQEILSVLGATRAEPRAQITAVNLANPAARLRGDILAYFRWARQQYGNPANINLINPLQRAARVLILTTPPEPSDFITPSPITGPQAGFIGGDPSTTLNQEIGALAAAQIPILIFYLPNNCGDVARAGVVSTAFAANIPNSLNRMIVIGPTNADCVGTANEEQLFANYWVNILVNNGNEVLREMMRNYFSSFFFERKFKL